MAGSDAHYVDIARSASARGELVLRRRGPHAHRGAALELRVNGVFVMDTHEVGTERALARTALDLLGADREPVRVLVGGLGLGFTTAEVLADPLVSECVVVEIEPELVTWLRDGTVPHGPALLADPRVRIVVADLADAIAEAGEAAYDLVLIDVDNGPGYLVHDANADLYASPFLHAVRRVLRPGGALAIWSAARAPALAADLADVFGGAERVGTHPLAVRLQSRAETYWLYTGRARDSAEDRAQDRTDDRAAEHGVGGSS